MYKVYLVDDEPLALIGIKKLFEWEKNGFEVVGESTDSIEALYDIMKLSPDVILIDIRMPELSGLELMKRIKQQGMCAIFVVVSGFSEFSYAQEALRLGALDYLVKPLALADAIKVREKILAQLKKTETSEPPVEDTYENQNFGKLLKYVKVHYTEDLSLKDLAAQFYINASYCSELFKKHLGTSFTNHINQLRIDKACYLLISTGDSIEVIAEKTGFRDCYYFSKVFKKYTSQTPNKYRRANSPGRYMENA